MTIEKTLNIKMNWGSFTYPIKKGTPISKAGALANNANAIGIVIWQINEKPLEEYLTVMAGGYVDLAELDYELGAAAINVMKGILFFDANGATGDKYTLPAASADAIGGVKQAVNVPDAAGEAPTAEEFKALLDALKDAGIVAPDPEPDPDDQADDT